MLFGMDGVEFGLIIVFLFSFRRYHVRLPGRLCDRRIGDHLVRVFWPLWANSDFLTHEVIDTRSDAYLALINSGVFARYRIAVSIPGLTNLNGTIVRKWRCRRVQPNADFHRQPHERAGSGGVRRSRRFWRWRCSC